MELSPKVKAFRRKILTDREVRQLTHAMKKAMGEPFTSAMAQYRISVADGLRFMAVSAHLVEAREARGLTPKALARQLSAPQYRVAEIEKGDTKRLDASVLARYIDAMELRVWFRRWESANRGLAKRLDVPEAGNLTSRFSGRSGVSRPLRGKDRAPRPAAERER